VLPGVAGEAEGAGMSQWLRVVGMPDRCPLEGCASPMTEHLVLSVLGVAIGLLVFVALAMVSHRIVFGRVRGWWRVLG
jgi:hypothetical protein